MSDAFKPLLGRLADGGTLSEDDTELVLDVLNDFLNDLA